MDKKKPDRVPAIEARVLKSRLAASGWERSNEREREETVHFTRVYDIRGNQTANRHTLPFLDIMKARVCPRGWSSHQI